MAELGKINKLTIVKSVDFGLYLDGGDYGEILLPKRYVTPDMVPGSVIEVFVYLDGEERPIATTLKPLAQVGDFAYLKVKAVERAGAFLEWGIMKDILVPFREQRSPMQSGKSYVVYLYVDKLTDRILATQKPERFFSKNKPPFKPGDAVKIMVWHPTDLGYKVIVENAWQGMLFKTDVFKPIRPGEIYTAYVKKLRDDNKLDLVLEKPGYDKVKDISGSIMENLKSKGGFIPLTDKSDPDLIYKEFGVSKKVFKQAIGQLYKLRKIELTEKGVRLLN